MSAALIAAWSLAGLFLIAAVWLLTERARLLREVAHADQDRDEAGRALEASVSEARALEEQLGAQRERFAALQAQAAAQQARLEAQREGAARLEAALEQRLGEQQEGFKRAMEASAGEALKQSAAHLLRLANENFAKHHETARAEIERKVQPIAQTLAKADLTLAQMEKDRLSAYASLAERLEASTSVSSALRQETGRLLRALSKPQVRGRFGELSLRRVIELAGMMEHVHFVEQGPLREGDDGALRPDVVVRLPNERCVVIDAKANLGSYLDALDAQTPEEAERHLERFAQHVAEQARVLGSKKYQSSVDGAAEFVVMFIPGDQFIDAALQRRPDLIAQAASERVILASPSTLIGLLSAVHVGWRERRLTESAEDLRRLGKELHDRVEKVLRDVARLGVSLEGALKAYNEVIGSVDSRVMPTLRKFEDAGAMGEKRLPEVRVVEGAARALRSLPAERETPQT